LLKISVGKVAGEGKPPAKEIKSGTFLVVATSSLMSDDFIVFVVSEK
jgi:hypothetical protein